MAESFFNSLKVEWLYKHNYELRLEAELSVLKWIENWHNRRRMHPSLGYKTIEEFENDIYNQQIVA
ncbi:IS3 family transposase [Maribacter antarcticus]|uniref:IS3 family transposase n=1 Tax=Maribacter antarcticus TaxID=505250 RepID=UPI00047A87FE|nr:IS3 family transposase [Maribacter antarcticus]